MENLENSLHLADSLDLLKKWYKEGRREFIDLNYNDPPFNSNRDYNILFNPETNTTEEAFKDTWSSVKYFDVLEDFKENDIRFYEFLKRFEILLPNDSYKAYLTIMGVTYWYIHQMIKLTGSLYHHCDPTTSHYMKIILDRIFDIRNFRNEIVWKRAYSTGGVKSGNTQFGRNSDTILYYTKSSRSIFNEPFIPWDEKVLLGKLDDNDGKGAYFWSPLSFYSEKRIKELEERKEIRYKSTAKYPEYKCYVKKSKGIPIGNLWDDILPLTPRSSESFNYPTQKPEKLLQRIIETSSNKGDLVADFFNGGGTTITVSSKLKRKFLGIDINYRAIQRTKDRLDLLNLVLKKDYYISGIPRSSKELRELVTKNLYGQQKNSMFALEDITTKFYLEGVQGNDKKVGDHSIDGVFSFVYDQKKGIGLVQITSSASINHLKALCLEVTKRENCVGVYVTFEDTLTDGIRREAKSQGRVGNVDKVQILTFEDLIDKGKQYEVPKDVLNI